MKIVIFCALLLSGCTPANDEIIRETKKCHEAGLDAVQFDNGDILCAPKESGHFSR